MMVTKTLVIKDTHAQHTSNLEVAYRLKGVTQIKTEKETVKESHLKVIYSEEDMDIQYDQKNAPLIKIHFFTLK